MQRNLVGRLRQQRKKELAAILDACLYADWQQVVLNGGPPCFHLDGMTFCFRAERWVGHDGDPHKFVSLHDFVNGLASSEVDREQDGSVSGAGQ